ncbi:MAG: DNA-binding protein Alba [Candidatus Methanofastidiosia archaeon]
MADDTVFVGSKPVINYVLAVITLFNEGRDKIYIKARGRSISAAVDVAEIVRNRFLTEIKVEDIKTGTEELPRREGGTINTSTIEITLSK